MFCTKNWIGGCSQYDNILGTLNIATQLPRLTDSIQGERPGFVHASAISIEAQHLHLPECPCVQALEVQQRRMVVVS